jgi:hypothetical protein
MGVQISTKDQNKNEKKKRIEPFIAIHSAQLFLNLFSYAFSNESVNDREKLTWKCDLFYERSQHLPAGIRRR